MNAYLLANGNGAIWAIFVVIIVLFILIYLGVTCIKVVRQSDAVIVERLGAYNRTLSHGLHLLTPIVEKAVPTPIAAAKEIAINPSKIDFVKIIV